jgi:hypothetical protein
MGSLRKERLLWTVHNDVKKIISTVVEDRTYQTATSRIVFRNRILTRDEVPSLVSRPYARAVPKDSTFAYADTERTSQARKGVTEGP